MFNIRLSMATNNILRGGWLSSNGNNGEKIWQEYNILHSEYVLYVHVIVIIVGFTIAITTYLVTLVDRNWESDFSPVLGIIFLSLCCIYGLGYVLKDINWKMKTVEGEVDFYSIDPPYEMDDVKDRIYKRMMFIKLLRINFELRATINALKISIYFFLAGFFLFILSYFLELGVLLLLAVLDVVLFINLLRKGKEFRKMMVPLEEAAKSYDKVIKFLRSGLADKNYQEDYEVIKIYVEVVAKKKMPEELAKIITLHLKNNTKPTFFELMKVSRRTKSEKNTRLRHVTKVRKTKDRGRLK